MSRSLSSAALQAIFAQETGEAVFFLVEIDHPDFVQPIRLVNNNENVISGGETYFAFPFDVSIPSEKSDELPSTQIRICNVDRQMIAALRALTTEPTVTLSVVLGSTPNTVEVGPFAFKLSNYSFDALSISGALGYEDILNEPFPSGAFNPAEWPGLFG
jgi:hypothetical protein